MKKVSVFSLQSVQCLYGILGIQTSVQFSLCSNLESAKFISQLLFVSMSVDGIERFTVSVGDVFNFHVAESLPFEF